MHTWNQKNALWMLLYVVLYIIATVLVCVLGSLHGLLFVLYQVMAAILVTGVAGKAFDRIRAPGVAACLGLGMLFSDSDDAAYRSFFSRCRSRQGGGGRFRFR